MTHSDPYRLDWIRDTLCLLADGNTGGALEVAQGHAPDQLTHVSESWDEFAPARRGTCPPDYGIPATQASEPEELVPSNKNMALPGLLRAAGYQCAYCGYPLMTPLAVAVLKYGIGAPAWPTGWNFAECHPVVLPHFPALEHVWPKSKGGHERHANNLVASCWRCNLTKGNNLLAELGWAPPLLEPDVPLDGLVEESLAAWYRIEDTVDEELRSGWPSWSTARDLVKGHERYEPERAAAARRRLGLAD